jgi:two-component system response regulator HydG
MPNTRNRILCVDKNEDAREMMECLLKGWNYEVAQAANASEGLDLARSAHFDMFLLDTHLPEISGIELCEQLCKVPGHAPVVFISAAAYEADKQRGLLAGASAYLTKPLDFDKLELTLARLLSNVRAPVQRKDLNNRSRVSAQACLLLS